MAQDAIALKRLKASISISVADANDETAQDGPYLANAGADACVQSLRGNSSLVYLVSRGGISVWRRGGRGRRRRGKLRSSRVKDVTAGHGKEDGKYG